MKKYYNNKNNHNSVKKNNYPAKHNNSNKKFDMDNFFDGNLVDNMKFGNQNHELSGYVKREVSIEDKYGNKKKATEQQFFNSGKNVAVRIKHNEKK